MNEKVHKQNVLSELALKKIAVAIWNRSRSKQRCQLHVP